MLFFLFSNHKLVVFCPVFVSVHNGLCHLSSFICFGCFLQLLPLASVLIVDVVLSSAILATADLLINIFITVFMVFAYISDCQGGFLGVDTELCNGGLLLLPAFKYIFKNMHIYIYVLMFRLLKAV